MKLNIVNKNKGGDVLVHRQADTIWVVFLAAGPILDFWAWVIFSRCCVRRLVRLHENL